MRFSLTIGGGPGTSGMTNPLLGREFHTFIISFTSNLLESPCRIGPNGTIENSTNPWSEKYNLLALDHVNISFICLISIAESST